MRVDNLGLFFKIECLLMWHYLGLLDLAVEILAIVREERLGVRVSNESIGTASSSSTLISSGQLLIYGMKIN